MNCSTHSSVTWELLAQSSDYTNPLSDSMARTMATVCDLREMEPTQSHLLWESAAREGSLSLRQANTHEKPWIKPTFNNDAIIILSVATIY